MDGYRGLPPTDGIRLGLGENARIICRPSGTEPKIKCYVEVVVPVRKSMDAARQEAQTTIDGVKSDLASTMGL
jgi:phosphomannomutase